MTIARRVAIDYVRRQHEQVSIESLADAPSAARTPEQDAERQSDADRLARLLSRLPVREREIIALKYGAEMTNRDIAAMLGLDVSRIQRLSQQGLDIPTLIGEQVEVLADPGAPQVFGLPSDASDAAGVRVRVPSVVPPNLAMLKTEVTGERQLRVAADTRRLQSVLDALGITDVQAPTALNGQVARLRIPPVVAITYATGGAVVTLLQPRSPEVSAPAGIDVAVLGQIGLRIAGLDPGAAQTLAQAIDWRATLIVPVPAGVSAFRQVDVQGQRGLYVESTDRPEIRGIAWSKDGIVYGLTGALNPGTLLQMANSVQ